MMGKQIDVDGMITPEELTEIRVYSHNPAERLSRELSTRWEILNKNRNAAERIVAIKPVDIFLLSNSVLESACQSIIDLEAGNFAGGKRVLDMARVINKETRENLAQRSLGLAIAVHRAPPRCCMPLCFQQPQLQYCWIP
jgi:hypothetical protein